NNARVVFGASVAVGKDHFETIIRDRLTFVDKSMLIKEFIESSDFVSLILRPRRFGKSTNLSMLNRFFKIPYTQEENVNCSQLFEKLKISTEKEIMQKHFAQYPIIHISLKDLNAGTWDEMKEKLRILIAEIYSEHRYLINNLYSDQQKKYQNFLNEESTVPQLSFALRQLSMYLRQHYKKQCIVLIDEYDSPMECAYNKGYYEVANEFFKGMFSSLLKSNDENVAKAMLVENLSPLYVDKFGFTSDEVELLLSLRKNLQINDVQKWYDGYISGGSTHLYNPWSIIRLLSRGILCAYWTDTGSTQTLEKYLWRASCSFKESVEKLLKREEWHNWVINVPFFTQGQTITSMLDNLLHGKLDLFSKEFENMIVDTLSFYDVRGSDSGKNAEYAGFERYDVKIVPKPGVNETAIIIEFKVVYDKKSLHDMAQEGLLQIEEKQYRVGLEENVKKLLEIGIAFEGKKACVLGHLLHRTEEGAWNKDYENLISD
ncbi:3386_t:CDS:2, partial [Dentiscutata erythropus]